MSIGFYSNNYAVKEYTIKNTDGSTAGTIRITKSVKKKPKRLNYNFKYISDKILMSSTSDGAGRALATAQANLGVLNKKLKSGQFDDKEVERAIIHAKKLERTARKKLKHLKEEEYAKKHGSCQEDMNENGISNLKKEKKEKAPEIKEEELKRLMNELKRLMKETMKESMEQMADELTGSIHQNMNDNDLELLKKKHRAKELQEILEANMKYLQACFNKLQKEKEESSKERCSSEGISLEISGEDMPVQTAAEMPVMVGGGSIDVAV